MPWLGARLREHHRPRHMRDAPPELAINEVAEPSGGESQRNQWRDKIGDVEPPLATTARKKPKRDQHAEEAPMETHAALPYGENLERMREVIEWFVEQHVAKTPAQNDAEHAVEQHVVDIARMPSREQVLSSADFSQHHERYEPDEIHEPVPSDGDGTDLECDRIELRMDEHRERRRK